MAASPILVDSSFYIRAMRAGQDPLRVLTVAAASRDLAICGVVRCEVARGLREPGILKRYQAHWDVMIYVPTDHRLWDSVELTLWRLDRQGIILPLPAVIVACCSLRLNAALLTHDEHFKRIPGVRTIDRIDL